MNQHQDYDKILRENFVKIGKSLLSKLCGVAIESIEDADTTLPRTIERRLDFLKMGIDPNTLEKTLYQLEFQSKVHFLMDRRTLLHYGLLYDKFGLPINQYVIYLGTGNWTAPTTVTHANLTFKYNIICINTIDYQVFAQSDEPEEIILAILADFKKEDKSKVVKSILTCLKDKVKNKRKLQKLIFQLEILSNLRSLQLEITKQISTMSIDYDITKDLRFIEGVEKEKTTNVISSYKNGIAIPLISNIFGLDESKIQQILKDNNLV